MSQTIYDSLIIGAGQAGLVTGYYLQRDNRNFRILEAQPETGGSWQNYWHSLTLFSSTKYDSLAGMAFPGDPGHYPTRDEVIAYLRDYARAFDLPVQTNTRITQVTRDSHFHVTPDDGHTHHARTLVIATGPFTKPYIPSLPGDADYQGRTLHSYQYREPSSFQDERVIVIGSNNSAVQVAADLAPVADVTLAVRKDIRWTPTHIAGIDVFFFLHDTGFDMLPLGCRYGLCASSAVYDDGTYQSALTDHDARIRPMFTRMTQTGVRWQDGTEEDFDTILYATGFRPDNLPFLESLPGALDDDGKPDQHRGVSNNIPGLYFIGREGQIAPASATLRGVSRDARLITRHLRAHLPDRTVNLSG